MPDPTNYHPEPCPFCGNPEVTLQSIVMAWPHSGQAWAAKCNDKTCAAQGPRREGMFEAIEAWNRRVIEVRQADP